GANRLKTLTGVTIPLVKGGLVAAFLFAFITSFDELTIAIFISGGVKTTLPKQMWDDMILQLNPTLAAVSVVVFVVVTVMLLVAERFRSSSSSAS
ncbi:MAG: ABC transporter permease subunit, partial [Bosea sp. (in: a-proteobacteria)]|nr:ABC transporter permease subunit [Bosea sp. (in: a-proteobacteria)]